MAAHRSQPPTYQGTESRSKEPMTLRWRIRLGLRWQIALLGMCGVLLVGGIYFWGLSAQATLQRYADTTTRLKILVDDTTHSFLRTYQIDTEFLLYRDSKLIASHDEMFMQTIDALTAIDAILETIPSDDPVQHARSFQVVLNQYAVSYQNVATAQRLVGLNENDGLEGNLRGAVHAIESRLAEFDEPRLTVLMLMMRRHEKDFLLRGDRKYGVELTNRAEEFTKRLDSTAISAPVKEEIKKLLSRYQSSFLSLMTGRDTLKDESTGLARTAAHAMSLMAEVKQAAGARYEQAQTAIAGARETTTKAMLWAIALTVLCAGALSTYVGIQTTRPLGVLATAMERAAAGDQTIDVIPLTRRDEIGAISRAFSVFQQGMREIARLSAERLHAAEREDAARKTAMLKFANEFEIAVGGIIETVSSATVELEASANSLAMTADSTQQLSTVVAAASKDASINAQSVAVSAGEMSSSVNEISRQVQESNKIANEAVSQAKITDARVNELAQAATHIEDVIKLISSVAEQTNLLALNATIEAARAGSAGKGFAIVAQEVKALAAQTAKATEDISSQIADMQAVTAQSVKAIKEISGTIGRISEISSIIAAAVEEQGAATQEISRNVGGAAKGIAQVATSITDVNRGAEETGSAAAHMLSSARLLSNESKRLKFEAQKFLSTVRSA